jgi:AbrB family looped-hinge helix DNA binding protein
MREALSVVTRKGQITVPAEVRRALGLKRGDLVAFTFDEDSVEDVHLKPVRSVAERTFGAIPARRRPEDLHQLRREYEEGIAEEVEAETAVDVELPR